MKKIRILLPVFLMFSSLTGCNKNTEENTGKFDYSSSEKEEDQTPKPHEHTYSTVFSYDSQNHWKESTCEHKDVISGLEAHTFVNNVCTGCGLNKNYIPKESTFRELLATYVPENFEKTPTGMIAIGMAENIEKSGVGKNPRYVRYPFIYNSKLLDNSPISLSGAVTIPFSGTKLVAKSVVISSHPTFTDLSEAPSNGFEIYTVPTITGSIVLEFDLLGYGITSDQPVDYHCRHLSTRHTIDGILAAGEWIKTTFSRNIFELPMFNMGYSQGGYDSLALLKYMEQEATEQEKQLINIVATHSGSGAYNPMTMLRESLANDNFPSPEYLLLAIVTALTFHKEGFGALTYNDFLTETGLELLEVLEEKNSANLQEFKSLNITSSRDVFKEAFFDPQNDLFKNFEEANKSENLLYNWTPKGELTLYYSNKDELVTPQCTTEALNLWEGLPNIHEREIGTLVGGDHASAAIEFYLYSVSDISDWLKNNK